MVRQNNEEALRLYRIGAEAGDLLALTHLGKALGTGYLGGGADPARAASWYRKALEIEPVDALEEEIQAGARLGLAALTFQDPGLVSLEEAERLTEEARAKTPLGLEGEIVLSLIQLRLDGAKGPEAAKRLEEIVTGRSASLRRVLDPRLIPQFREAARAALSQAAADGSQAAGAALARLRERRGQ